MISDSLIKCTIVSVGAVFVMFACTPSEQVDDSPTLAQVGNKSLTVEEALENIPSFVLRDDTLSAVQRYKEQWLNSQITLREAERLQLDQNPDIQRRIERLRNQLLEEALKEYVLQEHSDELEVTREEAQNYFQANKDKFVLDEDYVRFRHITTSTRAEADNAKNALMSGRSWEDVVEQYSTNPELQLRESTQYWPQSMAVSDIPMLNRYLNIIGISEISPVHFFRGEYHFVQLREQRNEGDHPDFNWLIPQIREWLKLEKSKRITNAFVRNLYLQAESNNEFDTYSSEEIEKRLTEYFSNSE